MAFDWSGNSYPKYDTSKGFGSPKQWRQTFKQAMGWDEAVKIVEEAAETAWSILGIAADATKAEIKAAYRKLAKEWHPDKFNAVKDSQPEAYAHAETMFKRIQAAYVLLTERR